MMHTNAPGELTDLVGRQPELEQLRAALARSRLVTMTGSIGVGKSRLALQLAWTVTGEIFYRTADSLSDLDVLPDATLLIIDGADAHLDAIRNTVERLLRSHPRLHMLVTSRTRLGLGVERVITISPFPVIDPSMVPGSRFDAALKSDAVTLLVARGADAVAGFALSESNAETLLGICAAVDGVPLAIECAAHALRVLDPVRLRRSLEDDTRLIDDFAPVDVPSFDFRFSQTWESCSDAERELARQLAVGADLVDIDVARAANGSTATDAELAALLAGLVDRSVLEPTHDDPTTFALLRATRRSILTRGRENSEGSRPRVEAHLVQLMRATAEAWAANGLGEQVAAITRHQVAIFALLERYAADPATARVALELICGLRGYWHWRTTARAPRARDWIESALRADPTADALRIRALRVDAYIALFENDELGAADQLHEADALAVLLGDHDDDGFGALVHGMLHLARHELAEAEERFNESLATALRRDARTRLGEDYWYLALLRVLHNDLEEASRLCDRGRAIALENGDKWGEGYALWMTALVTLRKGENDEALALVQRAIAAMSLYEDRSGLALCVQLLASIAAGRGDLQYAARLMGSVRDATIPELSVSEITPDVARQVRDELGAGRFDRLFGSSASMSPREAIEFAIASGADLIPPPAQPRGPLSTREVEVADLIAEGWSNADIATSFYISRRTVEGHVQRILAKLEFRSRSQVAAWVVTNRIRADREE